MTDCRSYIRNFYKRIFRFLRNVIVAFIISSIVITLIFRFVNPPVTALMLMRTLQQAVGEKDIRLKKDWIDIDELPDHIPLAFVAGEDQKFTEHFGFDIKSIEKAYKSNKKGKKTRGGSTISQQCAKNVFLWPKRSWLRKGLETWFTLLIELLWSKERILEVYLNVAEMGDGIYGINATAMHYYKKSASKLSRNEAAMVSVILPSPKKLNPSKPSGYMFERQKWVLQQMNNLGKLEL